MDYKKNLEITEEKIAAAAYRSGRNANDIKLLAVSKVFPVEVILEVYNLGLRLFGESRAQELRDKITQLPQDIHWHFIGPLQSNKIKYVVPNADLIHAVDTFKLAQSIAEDGKKRGLQPAVLIEINTSREEAKKGFTIEETQEAVLQIAEIENLTVKGLMTMAPFSDDSLQIRKSFSILREKFDEISKYADSTQFKTLSMGMSGDFEIAIEEGSTLVRIGTGIFGPRRRKE